MIFKLLYIIYTFSKNPNRGADLSIVGPRSNLWGPGNIFGNSTFLYILSTLFDCTSNGIKINLSFTSKKTHIYLGEDNRNCGAGLSISARFILSRVYLYFLRFSGVFQISHFRKRSAFTDGAGSQKLLNFIFFRVYLHFLRFAGFENLKIEFGKMKNFKNLDFLKIGNLEK